RCFFFFSHLTRPPPRSTPFPYTTLFRSAAQSLLRIARLKLAARALGVRRLDLGPQGGTVLFEEQSRIDPATVVHMIQKGSREYRLDGPLRLRVARALPTESARFEFAADLLGRLGEPPRVH